MPKKGLLLERKMNVKKLHLTVHLTLALIFFSLLLQCVEETLLVVNLKCIPFVIHSH